MMATVEHSTTCRACGRDTEPFLSFGELPLANALVPIGTKDESRFPLMMTFCSNCGLVQLAESVDPDSLFRHYVYLSSNSPAFLEHVRILTERLIKERALDAGSLVIEIASNDGYLLRNYRKAGIPVLGVEPARNIAQVARKDGIDTISEFFSIDLAATLRSDGKLADVIHANNVLAHVPDLRGFVAGLASVLKPAGMVVIEVPYVRDMIEKLEFDTAYHEHLCYFSLTPLVALFAKSGLDIFRVERIPVHGGSLRIFARHAGGGASEFSVTQMLSDERQWRVRDPALYRRFADAVEKFRPTLRECLAALRADGKSIAAYGASAKGATLLNYCGVDHTMLDFVVDRSATKQGFAMPGVGLPIFTPDELLRRQPDYVLLLAWNFLDEILEQQAEYRRRGGQFIVPVPEPRII
jgi:SAM-dependent methyltransferase